MSCFMGDLSDSDSTVTALHVVCPEVVILRISKLGKESSDTDEVNGRNLGRVQDRGFNQASSAPIVPNPVPRSRGSVCTG